MCVRARRATLEHLYRNIVFVSAPHIRMLFWLLFLYTNFRSFYWIWSAVAREWISHTWASVCRVPIARTHKCQPRTRWGEKKQEHTNARLRTQLYWWMARNDWTRRATVCTTVGECVSLSVCAFCSLPVSVVVVVVLVVVVVSAATYNSKFVHADIHGDDLENTWTYTRWMKMCVCCFRCAFHRSNRAIALVWKIAPRASL